MAAYLPAVRHDDLIWTSGQLPLVSGSLPRTGLVGADVEEREAYELARSLDDPALLARAHQFMGMAAMLDNAFVGRPG